MVKYNAHSIKFECYNIYYLMNSDNILSEID